MSRPLQQQELHITTGGEAWRNCLQESLIVTAAASLILLLALAYHAGGYLHMESAAFFHNYLADRPLHALIFDPGRNDWGMYQARELSYLFDYCDAQFLAWSYRRGWLHGYSLTNFLMIAATVFLQQFGLRRIFPKLPGWTITLLSLVFVLTPCVFENSFFRSAKYGCALAVTLVSLLSISLMNGRLRQWRGQVAGIAAALLLAALFDRQGAFFAAAYTGAAGFLLFSFRAPQLEHGLSPAGGRVAARVACGAFAATVVATFYNLKLAPWLVRAIHGYTPKFDYQSLGGLPLVSLPPGFRFVMENIGYAVTGLSFTPAFWSGCAVTLAAVIWFALYALRHRDRLALLCGGGLVISLIAMWLCAAGMVARHPAIMIPDVRYGTYFLPGWSLLILWAGPAAELYRRYRTAQPRRVLPNPVGILLALAILCQLGGFVSLRHAAREVLYLRNYQHGMVIFRRALNDPAYDYCGEVMPYRLEYWIEPFRR